MKVRNSLRSLKKRDKDCRVIRRKGRVYVINKKNPGSKPARVRSISQEKCEAVFRMAVRP